MINIYSRHPPCGFAANINIYVFYYKITGQDWLIFICARAMHEQTIPAGLDPGETIRHLVFFSLSIFGSFYPASVFALDSCISAAETC